MQITSCYLRSNKCLSKVQIGYLSIIQKYKSRSQNDLQLQLMYCISMSHTGCISQKSTWRTRKIRLLVLQTQNFRVSQEKELCIRVNTRELNRELCTKLSTLYTKTPWSVLATSSLL